MHFPRVMIAGVHSGVGKTTVTLGIMAALRKKGLSVQPYKVGPDYIDPGWHYWAAGQHSHNLDSWMGNAEVVRAVFCKHAADSDISVIEGVMGLFDGVKGGGIKGSSADIAIMLQIPVILVVNVMGMAQSCVAMVKGFMEYQPALNLVGLILNQASDFHIQTVKKALEEELGISVLGCLPRCKELKMPSRHLGLLPAEEHNSVHEVIALMADLIEQSIDLPGLINISGTANDLDFMPDPKLPAQALSIGVARDEAFSFYYQDSLDFLEELGAEIKTFSPLNDKRLPAVDGLYLGGGFPESFLPELAANHDMHLALRRAFQAGMPIYAECGALMYLGNAIKDFDEHVWSGAGIVPISSCMENSLVGMGYVEATARCDSILARAGETLKGHEFHYSSMHGLTEQSAAYTLNGGKGVSPRLEGYTAGNLLASYVHLHLRSNPAAAQRFVKYCQEYSRAVHNVTGVTKMSNNSTVNLREGYSTGTCAAAAAQAALHFLLYGRCMSNLEIDLPEGGSIQIPINKVYAADGNASAEVLKDGGDDLDVTHGIPIVATVSLTRDQQIRISGGKGVGIVTKPGLAIPVGEAAINPVPRRMITEAVQKLLPEGCGTEIIISAPNGEEAARKTMNQRLGIIGGISILGTTGKVRPMSEQAYLASLIPQIDQAAAMGYSMLILVPGAMGTRKAIEMGAPADAIVQCSNFFGAMLEACADRGIKGILIMGHIGKIVKLAGGSFNTHSHVSDARREILTAHLALMGARPELLRKVMSLNTMEESVELVQAYQMEEVYEFIAAACSYKCRALLPDYVKVGTVLYSLNGSILGYDRQSVDLWGGLNCQQSWW